MNTATAYRTALAAFGMAGVGVASFRALTPRELTPKEMAANAVVEAAGDSARTVWEMQGPLHSVNETKTLVADTILDNPAIARERLAEMQALKSKLDMQLARWEQALKEYDATSQQVVKKPNDK